VVSGSAALLVALGHALIDTFRSDAPFRLQTDPIRIVEAIVTGVAFLGAGTIFRRAKGDHIEGLTTAASLLLSAALGIAVALERFHLAVGITLLTLLVLRGLRFVERWIHCKSPPRPDETGG
jgi:putative Mg2+ transporter-C (MgtC) family protein